jgi:hypothetical protein
MNSKGRKIVTVAIASFALLLLVSVASSQPQASWAGKYEGSVKDDKGEERKLTLDLAEDAGKYSGTLTTGMGSFKILKGQIAAGALTLDIEKSGGSSGPMTLKKSGEGLTATFTDGGRNLTVDLKKAVAGDISGEWDAVADAQGQAFPFTLTLKVDGDKVTGASNSQLGTANISNGTWKDGKLSIVLEGGSGNITMVATIVEGKLSGDFDFAGQLSGKWVAQKKK